MAQETVNKQLLQQIDELTLSDRVLTWKEAIDNAGWRLYTERQQLATESWKATEGEDIQLRRAKLFKNIVENVPIKIQDFDVIAGRLTTGVIGACSSIDVCGDYIPDIWNDTDEIGMSISANAGLDHKSKEILREAARTFGGHTAADMTYKAWEAVAGSWARDAEDAKLKDPTLDVAIFGQTTSVADWPRIINRGLRAVIEEAQANIDRFVATQGGDVNRLYFWQSAIITLEACIAHAHRYAALAAEMAATETNEARKAQLLDIAAACNHVPEYPARSFQEALQSMAIIGVCKNYEHPMHNHTQWGRADKNLYPLFIRDINSGNITLEKAADLLEDLICRWGTQIFIGAESFKETHQINFGINNIMIGGVDKDHKDVSNELSYLILHAVGLLHLSSPTVGLRWNEQTPEWLMEKAIRTNLATKGGIPLFENDTVVIQHFVDDGIPFEEACEWCGLGCVYPCIPTRAEHYGAEGVAGLNLAAMLHMALHNGRGINGKLIGVETGDPRDFRSMEELYEAFKKQHEYVVNRIFWLCKIARTEEGKYMRQPFLSSVSVPFCMEAGQDLLIPDPQHSQFGISDRAIIDVADSLIAVKKLVFEEKKLTMKELVDALDSNFEGARGEEIRQMCLKAPKFGNDIDEVDLLAKDISAFSGGVIKGYDDSPYNGYMIAREGLAWHYAGGLGVGALPDGRKSKEPLNDGSFSPMRCADKNGPTAVLRSVIKTGFPESHATVLNQKFSVSILQSEESQGKLVQYTNAFLKNGGTHIQYNIVDTKQLIDAKKHPEKYKDLIVRIGGFSAFFTQLSPEIQDDVIFRSEHVI